MELNVAVIMKWVDRLSAPAAASARSMTKLAAVNNGVVRGSGEVSRGVGIQVGALSSMSIAHRVASRSGVSFGKAMQAATAPTRALGSACEATASSANMGAAAADTLAKATAAAAQSVEGLTAVGATAARTVVGAGRSLGETATEADRLGGSSEGAARKVSLLERVQQRGVIATRSLRSELGGLQDALGNLAMGSIVTDGLERAGRGIVQPLRRATEQAAQYQRSMTGIGIMADLTDRQLAGVSKNIMATAQTLAIPVRVMQDDDMQVLNKGVYRDPAGLKAASLSAARLSLLSETSGSPISGPEAAGLMATYAHAMGAPAAALDRLNATVFRSSQLGGMRVGNVARFVPEIMGQMKLRAFGNYDGLVDALTALQLTERMTGDDQKAGDAVVDLGASLSHMLTERRFRKMGIDLSRRLANDNKTGIGPLTSAVTAIMEKIGSRADDPQLADKLGKFFVNQYAGKAAASLILYQNDTKAGLGYKSFKKAISAGDNVPRYYAAIDRARNDEEASLVRLQNAQASIAVSTGKILAPAMEHLANAMSSIANVVTKLEERHSLLSKTLVYGIGAVGVTAIGLGGLGNAIMGVAAPIIIARSLFRMLPLAAEAGTGRLAATVARLTAGAPAAAEGVGALAGAVEGISVAGLLAAAGGLVALGAAAVGLVYLVSKYGPKHPNQTGKGGPAPPASPGQLAARQVAERMVRLPNLHSTGGKGGGPPVAVHVIVQQAQALAHVAAAATAPPLPAFSGHPVLSADSNASQKVATREVHHHQPSHNEFHIHGVTDVRRLARELDRLRSGAARRQLHDESDG